MAVDVVEFAPLPAQAASGVVVVEAAHWRLPVRRVQGQRRLLGVGVSGRAFPPRVSAAAEGGGPISLLVHGPDDDREPLRSPRHSSIVPNGRAR